MVDALEQFIANAEHLVSQGYYEVQGQGSPGVGLTVPLAAHRSFPVIAEIKVGSPSAKELSSHPPGHLIESYASGGAAALSVLTEPSKFHGSLDSLRTAMRSGLPVLMKDFIISERQLEAGATLGAGTVLMIEEVFETAPRRRDELMEGAHDLGLEVLLEAGSREALSRAMTSEADILGINQRNLRTLVVEATKGVRLLPLALTSSRPVVVMSGLDSADGVRKVRDAGGSGVLIGSHLALAPDPVAALKALEVPR
jgi:indole-3-glycerol phosphate synthase